MTDDNTQNQSAEIQASDNEANTVEATSKINRELKEKHTSEKAEKLGMSYIDVGKEPINADVLKLLDRGLAEKAMVIPFYKMGKKLRIALAHPTNKDTLAVLAQLKKDGYLLNYTLSTEESISEALKNYKGEIARVKEAVVLTAGEKKSLNELLDLFQHLGEKMEDMTSEEMFNALNVASMQSNASDIHIQPEEGRVSVRFRVDGQLHTVTELSKNVYEQLANQIKYQSKLKLNISNVPQDGRYFFVIDERKVDVRVSALPTEYGETFVCRLLDSSKGIVPLDKLGFTDKNWELLQKSVQISEGMILLTGPTGSGKTTTLYSMLNEFNKPEVKIITLEDPIEYHIENISQSQINEKRGYTFASGLRAILRQDPDVVMIGEIRDGDTAQTAVQAALTGHVVLSTLHTNSAIESIPRLINMNIEPFMLAPAGFVFIAQRLVRKICSECSEDQALSESEKSYIDQSLSEINSVEGNSITAPSTLKVGKGCNSCGKTGYSGRISIVEMLHIDNDIKNLILNRASSQDIFKTARSKGMLTMQEDGVKKIISGITTIAEVKRVTSTLVEEEPDETDQPETASEK